jgi:hypothetical protein
LTSPRAFHHTYKQTNGHTPSLSSPARIPLIPLAAPLVCVPAARLGCQLTAEGRTSSLKSPSVATLKRRSLRSLPSISTIGLTLGISRTCLHGYQRCYSVDQLTGSGLLSLSHCLTYPLSTPSFRNLPILDASILAAKTGRVISKADLSRMVMPGCDGG